MIAGANISEWRSKMSSRREQKALKVLLVVALLTDVNKKKRTAEI